MIALTVPEIRCLLVAPVLPARHDARTRAWPRCAAADNTGHEGGDTLAEGHHTESLDAAVESAVRNLENGIVPTFDELCDCEQ
ncbi:hypothetical protein [Nocardia rhizosphaerae]|uniref:Uncharacterized protein n=1 Tax=Nocardia rhizosphaerae TaxID=1691571 RepID=A0ABV8L3U3_9NOCA